MRGFTIIELMITLTILVILIGLAAPSLSDLVRDQRVKTATSDVHSALVYARSEAIKRNADVRVAPTGGDWGGGWQVQVAGGAVLKAQDALSGIKITQKDESNIGTITFRGDGRLLGAVADIVVKSSESASVTARCIRLDLGGRPSVKADPNKNPSDGCW